MKPDQQKIVVLISGRGTNLLSLINACNSGQINGKIESVISNRPGAQGLEIARTQHIPAISVDHKHYQDRANFEAELIQVIDTFEPDIILFSGFMRILGEKFTAYYAEKMLNIHPSLLPKFSGLKTHARALDNNEIRHGASIHFVTSELDGGPVVMQASLSIKADHTPESLAADVLKLEHQLYPKVVSLVCAGRIKLENKTLYLDNKLLSTPLQMESFIA